MDPNGGAPKGVGKKKSKKNQNQGGQQDVDKSQPKNPENPPQQQKKPTEDKPKQPQGQSIEVPKQNSPKGKKDQNQGDQQNVDKSQLKNPENPSQQQKKKQGKNQPLKQPQGGQSVEDPKEQNIPKVKKGKNDTPSNKTTQDQTKQLFNDPEIAQKQDGNQQIEQTIEIFKNSLRIPKRKNPKVGGTLGRVTEIDVNYLPLNLDKLFTKTVYHIDVQFKPELPKRLLRTALDEFNRKHYPNINFAFDGRRNMYTTKDLKGGGKSDTISVLNDENNRLMEFNIVTSVVNTIQMFKIQEYLKNGSSDLPPGEAFQALDIILKNRPFSLRFTNIGRSFFPTPQNTPVDLGEGMELWKGFFQSPVMGWKPYLNIDVAHKGFPKYQPLISYISNELRCDLNYEMDVRNKNTLSNYVKGLKIEFMVPNQPNTKRSYKAVGLLESAENFSFNMEEASPDHDKSTKSKNQTKLNVVQYFKMIRNYTVRYPKLPCLHVGNVNKKTAVPIELCTVQKGQLRLKKLTENQTANMVKNAARPPRERRQTIEDCIRNIKYNQDPVLKEFGIEIKEQFATIPARVLDQPLLSYAHKDTKPNFGVWKPDKFSKPVQLCNWVVVNMDGRTNPASIKNFEKILITSGRDLNVHVNQISHIYPYNIPRNGRLDEIQKEVTKLFNNFKAKHSVELIVVIIPDYPSGIYAAVKQSSELTVGVLTQCIKSKTMFKMNMSTASNILLKINSKLNGINHTLSIRSSPKCMEKAIIFGADVTHPSPDQINIPSVAAVAASHDLCGSQYNMEWRLQPPKVEIIKDLEDIVHKQLLKFRKMTEKIPEKIFYFRDGVSEGQFKQLLESELIAIRRACLRLNINYKPPITFLVVQKRHHTRMFPKNSADFDGKFGNVPSGTIIDTQITHPTELDFYLCSHASIQGTSRPTKYHLLWDDNNFTEDQLEQITFYLCFMFARCTRSVSYPAPTYYAHLAAFRARAYIENKQINLNRLEDEQVKNELNSAFTVHTPMFFV